MVITIVHHCCLSTVFLPKLSHFYQAVSYVNKVTGKDNLHVFYWISFNIKIITGYKQEVW